MFQGGGDRFYSVRVVFITLDEKSGNEKRACVNMLIQASDIQEAKDNLNKGMKDTMMDYVIEGIKETRIMDVFPYKT